MEKTNHRFFPSAAVATVLLVLAAVLLTSCGDAGAKQEGGQEQGGEQTIPSGEKAESAGKAIGATVADITDDANEFYGKKVTVSGLVTQVVNQNAFVIGGGEFGDSGLLIVGAKKLSQIVKGGEEGKVVEIQEQDLAQVTGKVREFNRQQVNDQIGYYLDDRLFEDFEEQPAVVADQVVLSPWQGSTPQAQQGVPVSLSNLIDEPAEFYGQKVTVNGTIAQLISSHAFVLVRQQTAQETDEGVYDPDALTEEGVLVVSGGGTRASLSADQPVRVTGRVRQADVQQLEEKLGVEFNEDKEAFTAFEEGQGPAIVASQIQAQ